MAYKPRSSKKYAKKFNPMNRLMKKKLSLKKPLSNTYIFKRLGPETQIQHRQGDAGNVWQIVDPGSMLTPTSATNTAWGSLAIPGAYFNGFGTVFRLNQVSQSSDFTNMFDRYKIVGVKVTFLYSISDAPAGGQSILPTLYYCSDYDDNNPPSFAQIRQKQNVKQKILQANKPVSIYIRPKKLLNVSDGGGNSNSIVTSAGWNNCDFSGINHLGLKFFLTNLYGGQPATTTVNTNLDIKTMYYIACKDPQ